MKRPRQFRIEMGDVCEAGQHNACCAVGDPFDDQEADVFVCSCACHRKAAQPRPADATETGNAHCSLCNPDVDYTCPAHAPRAPASHIERGE